MLNAVLLAVFSGLVWTVYFNFIQWFRQRSPEARERAVYKERMPGWLRQTELMLWIAFFLGIFFALLSGLFALNDLVHPSAGKPKDIVSGIFVFSSMFGALAPAMLAANLVSWLVPAMRRANEKAMTGLPPASFRQANLGLTRFAGIVVPLCLAAAMAGVFYPWH